MEMKTKVVETVETSEGGYEGGDRVGRRACPYSIEKTACAGSCIVHVRQGSLFATNLEGRPSVLRRGRSGKSIYILQGSRSRNARGAQRLDLK